MPTTGTWSPVTNLSESVPTGYTAGVGTMELLTNGEVMAQGGGFITGTNGLPQELVTSAWYRLTPNTSSDTAGSYGTEYTSGAWTTNSGMDMGTDRQYFASNVLPNGKLLVVGGELSDPPATQLAMTQRIPTLGRFTTPRQTPGPRSRLSRNPDSATTLLNCWRTAKS